MPPRLIPVPETRRNAVFPVDLPPGQNSLAQNGSGRGGQACLNHGNLETILNRFIPAGGRSFQYAAWGVVLLVLVHLGWLQLRPESELHRLCAFATRSAASRTALMPYEQLDRIAGQTVNGNVLLKLVGYAKTNPVVENSLSFAYFRASYALYPRRIYAAPADKVINNGRDIMRSEFSPSQQWLQEHDVRSVFTFGNDKAGGETLRWETLPPRDDRAGMPTDKSGGN
jgi:hypothetical protein